MPKVRVWTEAYQPFIMGGDVYAPIGAEVDSQGPIKIGKGVSVYIVTSPKGRIHVAESITGAFVGTSLDQVKADVKEAKPSVIKKQIAAAKERLERVHWIGEQRFWSQFREKP